MIVVFVSGPITDGGRLTYDEQRDAANAGVRAGIELAQAGYAPYIPHLNWFHPDTKVMDSWYEVDLAVLERCDAVVRLPGQSYGAYYEEMRAHTLGIPVFGSVVELVEADKAGVFAL